MELYILSKQDLSILSICKLADYQINLDEETNAKSTFTLMKTNGLKKGNYMTLNGLYRQFIFVIDDVQTEKGSNVVTVTALDISNIFDRKVIEKNIDTMKSKSIEEFLANTISENFVNSDDTALNVNYIEIYWHTNTQGNVATNAENGLYNFHTFLTNCRQYKNIYTDFKLENLGNPQTVEGKRINIEAKNRKIVDIMLEGESQQATRSGKNLFDSSQIVNVRDYIVANGTGIKIIKTTNGRISPLYNISLKANTEYTISCNLTSTTTYPTMYCQWRTNDGSTLWRPNLSNGSTTFTPSKDIVGVIFYLQNTDTDGTYVELTNLQIEKGSTATDYELYGVMPSPDYPSEIESVKGKNLFDENKSEWGKYNVWQHNTGNYANAFVNVINIKGLDKCSISFKNNTRTFRFGYQFIDDNENYLSGLYWSAPTNEKIVANISVPENASKIIISQLDGQKEDDIKIQLEKGTVATPYVPYNSLEFKDEGKNKFNVQDTNSVTEGITVDNEGWITVTGDNTDGTATKFFNYFTNNLALKTVTNYNVIAEVKNVSGTGNINFVSVNANAKQFQSTFNKNFSVLANNTIYNSINKTADEFVGNSGLRTYIGFSTGQSGSITFRLSVLEDTTVTPENFDYEPYKSQVAYFPLGEEKLMEGSYLADDEIHNKRKQIVFDGSREYIRYTPLDSANYNCFYTNQSDIYVDSTGTQTCLMSNYFKGDKFDNRALDIPNMWVNKFASQIYFKVPNTITTVEELTTLFAEQYANGTPVIVEYELAEEETVPYTAEQQEAWNKIKNITLFEGVNHISSEANMFLKYYPLKTVGLKFVLRIDIENKQETTELIDTTLPEVTDYNKIYEEDVTAKVQVYIREDGSEYNLYLKTDRTTTTNKDDPDRASGKIEVISVETADKAEEEALNVMKGNNYKHLVEFKITKTSKLMDITKLHIRKTYKNQNRRRYI